MSHRKGNNNTQGGKKNTAPASETANSTNASAETTNVTETGNEGEGKPAETAPVATAKKVVAKKQIPLKNAPKGGGTRSTKATYNVGECSYSALTTVTDKETGVKDTKFLRHILNGAWFPTFNGDPAMPVDNDRPVFESLDAAHAAGAVEFGVTEGMPKIFGFMPNVHLKNGEQKTSKPGIEWHGFITATADNLKTVVANMKKYLDSPYTQGNVELFTMLEGPYKLTKGKAVAAEISLEAEPA